LIFIQKVLGNNFKKKLFFIMFVCLVFGFVFLLGWGISNRTYITELSGSTRIGKPAPDFSLNLFDQEEILESSTIEKPMVINFWASWCAPCIEEAAILQSVWDNYKKDSVEFIGINIQDSNKSAKAFINSNGINYINGFDQDGIITIEYGVIGMPTTFFVNKEGIVEAKWVGSIPDFVLDSWVKDLLNGRKINFDEFRAENRNNIFLIGD
tara:strand:+ start:45839 stop:46468 length:630 start_codon:yes stop_codon:yes gene_type:complete